MSHVFFFSYAHSDKDERLERFFEDLCKNVKLVGDYEDAKDPRLCFRDSKSLPLMVKWEPKLMDALQASSVLVCLTSPGYFLSRFCGQEYYLFKRRRFAKDPLERLPVILPIIWEPCLDAPAEILQEIQWKDGDFHEEYSSRGLRSLMIRRPEAYEWCVDEFGRVIKEAFKKNYNLPKAPFEGTFDDIPNAFSTASLGHQCMTEKGHWRGGPSVANFVFAVGTQRQFPESRRHGQKPAEWRPFLPPHPSTIGELTMRTAKGLALGFREIPLDKHFNEELDGARKRKNLTVVITEPESLTTPECSSVTGFDTPTSVGSAVLVPGGDPIGAGTILAAFPVRSAARTPPFHPVIDSQETFEALLESTLVEIRDAVVAEIASAQERGDDPPVVLGM